MKNIFQELSSNASTSIRFQHELLTRPKDSFWHGRSGQPKDAVVTPKDLAAIIDAATGEVDPITPLSIELGQFRIAPRHELARAHAA